MSDTAEKYNARIVMGEMNFIGPMKERPRYHANDSSRDVLNLDPHSVEIEDKRLCAIPPSLTVEGFALYPHHSAVRNFRDLDEVARVNAPELRTLLLGLSGADVVVMNPTGVLRFGERSPESGELNNSRPARFVHVDISDATARMFSDRSAPAGKKYRRSAHYNVWRVLTPAPQDVPLAVCDARSVGSQDVVLADAIFDMKDAPEWSFEGVVIKFSTAQRWAYFSNMNPDEVIVFKTNDSDPAHPSRVPHSAFNDPGCPAGATPRASIEMRGIAYWFS
jgi:hypothetical protein